MQQAARARLVAAALHVLLAGGVRDLAAVPAAAPGLQAENRGALGLLAAEVPVGKNRGERSQKVVPIRDAILSDQNKSAVLKSRIVEDMIGRPVDDSTVEIVSFLAESEDESLSAISKILLAEIESATS